VSEARLINRAEILTARTGAAKKAAEVAAAEAAAAKAAAAEAAAAVEAALAAEAVAKAAAEALGARAALVAELPKEHDGGTGGMAKGAEEILEAGCLAAREQTRPSRQRDQRRSKF
jgi:hypothetical protein